MNGTDDNVERPKSFTDDEVKTLMAQMAEAVRKGAERKRSLADKFWDRLASISTFVGSVVLGAVALMFNCNYNAQQRQERLEQANLQHSAAASQGEMERMKFLADEQDRQRKIVVDLSPKILSTSENDRGQAQALLSHFYPEEAPRILRDLTKGDPKAKQQADTVIARADQDAAAAGGWGIVVGHDGSLEDANAEVRKAGQLGFSAGVYKKGSRTWFITLVLGQGQSPEGFGTEVDAQSANYTVRSQIRAGTYVVNLKEWCKNPEQASGYTQCSNE